MLTKQNIIDEARRLGFADIGFTDAAPFTSHKDYLLVHQEEYGLANKNALDLLAGCDPKNILPTAKSLIVLLDSYFEKSFPQQMERHFGRTYLEDDRVIGGGMILKIINFLNFLKSDNIQFDIPYTLPQRMTAARAGLGTFGKNGLLYATRAARGSSFVVPVPIIVDMEFAPDESTIGMGCPDWCRSACVAACPTRALQGNARLDPRLCISYLTYSGDGMIPPEMWEQMGLCVYGCDRCQDVCPRNAAWITEAKPINLRVAAKADDFELSRLLHMDKGYFENKIHPHMFYMSAEKLWRWQMSAARAMGNSRNPAYIADLNRALQENTDERVRSMCAWALTRLGKQPQS